MEKVAGEITPAEVYYGLGLLEKKSYITEADSTIPPDRAAFWHVLGLEPHLAESRMKETTVEERRPPQPSGVHFARLEEEHRRQIDELRRQEEEHRREMEEPHREMEERRRLMEERREEEPPEST